jgi:hypothetical protein
VTLGDNPNYTSKNGILSVDKTACNNATNKNCDDSDPALQGSKWF